jgi:deoxyribose-phosphate aldolase
MGVGPTADEFAQLIDHTNLHAAATRAEMERLCDEAREHHFRMVAINQVQTSLCRKLLEGSDVHVGAAISFPLGQTSIQSKVFDTEDAIRNGADEIDYVINITELKAGNLAYLRKEMDSIVQVCRDRDVLSKVIFENCYLTSDEIRTMSEIAVQVRPDFIKTSTGFGTGGATIEDVRLMKSVVGETVKVKAAGGIRTLDQALLFIDAGVQRIGTSSGVGLVNAYSAHLSEASKATR